MPRTFLLRDIIFFLEIKTAYYPHGLKSHANLSEY
jgi:hypothetical protein